jgi:hypothetical protein
MRNILIIGILMLAMVSLSAVKETPVKEQAQCLPVTQTDHFPDVRKMILTAPVAYLTYDAGYTSGWMDKMPIEQPGIRYNCVRSGENRSVRRANWRRYACYEWAHYQPVRHVRQAYNRRVNI